MPFLNRNCFPVSRRQLLAGMACSLIPCRASAQRLLSLKLQNSCSFYPEDKISTPLYSFESSEEALTAIKRITNVVGLEPNFEVLQASISYAVFCLQKKQQIILYNH